MMCTTVLHGSVCHRTSTPHKSGDKMKEKKYRIWCGANILCDTSAFVNPTVQLLLTGGVRSEWMASA